MKSLSITFLLLLLISCSENKEDVMSGTSYIFQNQPSNYLLATNAYRVDVGEETGESNFDNTYHIKDANSEPVKFTDYIIKLHTQGYSLEMMSKEGFNISDYIGEPVLEIEKQLNQHFNKLKSTNGSSLPNANIITIEYRTEELKSIKVKSTSKLFGIEPGESLNDYVEIYSGSMLFDYSKQLIGALKSETSIAKYLSYRPLVGAELQLRFKNIPDELPLTTEVIIEIELDNGKMLTATTSSIKLTE